MRAAREQALDRGAPKPAVRRRPKPMLVESAARSPGWGDTEPLCLIAFAAVTLMNSVVNAHVVSAAALPVIISTGLIFGGATQLIAGLIQFRTGNTLNGSLFSTYGGFWIVLPAYLQWFTKGAPPAQVKHATGLFLFTFAIIAAIFVLVSFRTTIATVLALINLLATLLLLAVGNSGGHPTLLHIGGVSGIILAAQALYIAAAKMCEYSYGRTIIPLGPLSG